MGQDFQLLFRRSRMAERRTSPHLNLARKETSTAIIRPEYTPRTHLARDRLQALSAEIRRIMFAR